MNAPQLRKLGPYQLEILLGQGGMGEVFRAYDGRLDRHVAVKHVRPEILDEERARARFRREARTIARLNHPAIVQIFDLIEEEDGDWIVMELLEGRTLAEELHRGRVPLVQGLTWAEEIALALAEAHEKKVIHRDLKPSNVFITMRGRVKILDFGLAKQIVDHLESANQRSISASGAIVGTGSAMSPEQARGQALDHRSDLFSLGTLVYHLLTGISPFLADGLANTLKRVLYHRPTPLMEVDPQIPSAISDLVSQLHEKSPELRPASARTVANRLIAVGARLSSPAMEDTTIIGPSGPIARASDPNSTSIPSAGSKRSLSILRSRALVGGAVVLLSAFVLIPIWYDGAISSDFSEPTVSAPAPHLLYQEGLSYLERYDQADNINQAIAVFQRMLLEKERSAAAYAGLAQAYWWRYRSLNRDPIFLVQAQGAAQQAVDIDEYLADARVIRGLVSFDQGHPEAAKNDFEVALTLEPRHAGAYFGMAQILERQGRVNEAEAAFLQAVEYAPEDRSFYDHLGAFYYKIGRYQEAQTAFHKSIKLVPDAIDGRRNLAAALYMQGRYSEAAREVQAALKIEASPSLYSTLGTLLFAQGLYPAAASAFEKALALDQTANDYRYWANLADAYRWTASKEQEARQSYLRAIQLIREMIQRQPDDPTLRSRLASYLAKRGDLDEALIEVDLLAKNNSLDASTFYRMAVVYEVCGQRRDAVEVLDQALRSGFSKQEVGRDPELIGLRSDPMYHRLMVAIE